MLASYPREGNGTPVQCSCLENPRDGTRVSGIAGRLFTVLVTSSVAQSCPTLCDPWTAACQASLSITKSRSLLKLMSIESVMPSNHLILCCLFSFCPPSFAASGSFPMSQLFASGGQVNYITNSSQADRCVHVIIYQISINTF